MSTIAKEKKVYIDGNKQAVLAACIAMDSPMLFIGETGLGKTTIIREEAKKVGKHLDRVSVNGATSTEEILGRWLAKDGTTFWQDGILTKAMRDGSWIVFDEINAALPEILFVLHSLLDDDRSITLVEKDNEVVKPSEGFRFFATMNPPEEYSGTKEMNRALVSRFTAVVHMEVPNASTEIDILKDIGCDEKIAMHLVTLAEKLRKAKADEEIFYFCSTRDLIHASNLHNHGLPIKEAVTHAIWGKMSKAEQVLTKKIHASTSVPSKGLSALIEDAEKALASAKTAVSDLSKHKTALEIERANVASRDKIIGTLQKEVETLKGSKTPGKSADIRVLLKKAMDNLDEDVGF